MGIDAYFVFPIKLRRMREGPLGPHVDLFADRLLEEGHSRQSAWRNLAVVCDFSHWLARRDLDLHDIDERTVDAYQRFRARYRCPLGGDRPALLRLLSVLREAHVILPPHPAPLGPLEQQEEAFLEHLRRECGLARVSAIRHRRIVRLFLKECADAEGSLSRLEATDVTRFVERHVNDQSPRSAQMMCWTLRSLLRYLQYRGDVCLDMTGSVPTIRRWRLATLPSFLEATEIENVLAGSDRSQPVGRRDYAILLLLARIGLRANEIRLLCLEDIDWGSGRLTVHGKGGRSATMPLPMEVGAAIADYLQHGRPRCSCRHVFLRHLAPHRGFTSSSMISQVAKAALRRAGVERVAHRGAHLFRHSLATRLLRAGASLTEIGQVLRHQKHDTTRIYAKVDLASLRSLAQPWPGGTR